MLINKALYVYVNQGQWLLSKGKLTIALNKIQYQVLIPLAYHSYFLVLQIQASQAQIKKVVIDLSNASSSNMGRVNFNSEMMRFLKMLTASFSRKHTVGETKSVPLDSSQNCQSGVPSCRVAMRLERLKFSALQESAIEMPWCAAPLAVPLNGPYISTLLIRGSWAEPHPYQDEVLAESQDRKLRKEDRASRVCWQRLHGKWDHG